MTYYDYDNSSGFQIGSTVVIYLPIQPFHVITLAKLRPYPFGKEREGPVRHSVMTN